MKISEIYNNMNYGVAPESNDKVNVWLKQQIERSRQPDMSTCEQCQHCH